MMVYFSDKTEAFGTVQDSAAIKDALQALVADILEKGLGLKLNKRAVEMHGGLCLGSLLDLENQGMHRDCTFAFAGHDQVLWSFNLVIYKKRSVVLFPRSHLKPGGGVTTAQGPIEV